MTNPQEMALRATSVADYLKSHEGASIADVARDLNCAYHKAHYGYVQAVELNLIGKREHKKGPQKGIRPATMQKAEKVAEYLKSHENARIVDVARALNYSYARTLQLCSKAVQLNLIEKRESPHHSPATLENMAEAVELRRQGKSLRAVGADMGISHEMARQLLGIAVKQGSMSDKERSDLKQNGIKRESWNYFFELAGQIENINTETYHALAKKHRHSAKYPIASACQIEKRCLEMLVQHADPQDPDSFTEEDAELMTWVLSRIKKSPLSLSELKKMADEYITTGIKLPDLGIKYGIAKESDVNPSARTLDYVRFAEKLNLVSREDCDKKGRKTRSEICKKLRKYPEHIIKTAIAACERGIPGSEVAKVFGIYKHTLYGYVSNHRKQAESSERQ
jgi:hypothetical protein